MTTDIFGTYADYYDLLNSDKDYASETKYYERIFSTFPNSIKSILEFGSGTGSHAIHLSKSGYKVTGVDLSNSMVRLANSKLQQAGVNKADATIIVDDIRTMNLTKTFDVVLSSFHVMSYLITNQDLIKAFSTAQRHLEVGGYFVFDFWYSPGVKNIGASSRTKTCSNGRISITRTTEPVVIDKLNSVEVKYTFEVTDLHDATVISFEEIHKMRHLDISEISELSGDVFEIVNMFGDNTLEVPTQDTWSALVVLKRIK